MNRTMLNAKIHPIIAIDSDAATLTAASAA